MNEGLGELRVSKTLFYYGDEENGRVPDSCNFRKKLIRYGK